MGVSFLASFFIPGWSCSGMSLLINLLLCGGSISVTSLYVAQLTEALLDELFLLLAVDGLRGEVILELGYNVVIDGGEAGSRDLFSDLLVEVAGDADRNLVRSFCYIGHFKSYAITVLAYKILEGLFRGLCSYRVFPRHKRI